MNFEIYSALCLGIIFQILCHVLKILWYNIPLLSEIIRNFICILEFNMFYVPQTILGILVTKLQVI